MLLEFTVKNFRSIQEAQTLSMVANKDSLMQDTNCFESGLQAIPKLLRSAVVYGANASGKSNLILAMLMMKDVVINSAVRIREGDKFVNITPFLFDQENFDEATEFEITFIDDGVRYQYGFAINKTRILKEWLLVYKARKAQRWFERNYDNQTKKYEWYFGPHLLENQKHNLWKESTRINALFLSTAVNLNSEQLRPIYNWFYTKLVINISGTNQSGFNLELLKNAENKEKVIKFLQAADLNITDIELEYKKFKSVEFKYDFTGSSTVSAPKEEMPVINFYHKGIKNENVKLPFEHESHGTKKLALYAEPILNVLKEGSVFVVDELEAGLHPKMVQFIINLFHDSDLNTNNAQLIFSTHQTSLLDTKFLRRDQVWFMEKNDKDASVLYPLTDFSPRASENIERGYLQGRFGANPFLGALKY